MLAEKKFSKPTMASELARLLDEMDEEEQGLTVRTAMCKALIRKAKDGNMKAFEFVRHISGEQGRELWGDK